MINLGGGDTIFEAANKEQVDTTKLVILVVVGSFSHGFTGGCGCKKKNKNGQCWLVQLS
jgi:hypothetical protein